jgi:hypothetical protein
MSQLGRYFGYCVLALSPIAACSVINSYDDVVPLKGAGGLSNGGAGGTHSGGASGGSTAGGDVGGEAGEPGSGGSSGVPAKGLLIVGGTDPT